MNFKQTLHHLNLRSTHLLPKFNKPTKIILTICLIFYFSLSLKSIFASTIKIDTTGALQQYSQKQTAIEKGNNQESWINESLVSNVVSLNQAIIGPVDVGDSSVSLVPGGLIGFTNRAIASLYQPPASGSQYIANSINSFLGKPTYAAGDGFGFSRLNGILGLWKKMRNTVYTLISLFFVVTGIMIMLRVKLSPQATVTIQSSIPSIISSLILVTFSYAIAGLMIDFSYIVMGLVLSIIHGPSTTTISQFMTMDFSGVSSYLTQNVVSTGTLTLISGSAGAIALGVLAALQHPIIGALALGLGLILVLIIILIQVLKFFFGLAKCYIMLLIRIILGPLEIGMGAIPGSKLNFSSWFTEVLANISVFPISVIFLSMMSAIIKACQDNDIWAPPLLGNGNFIAFILGIASLFILSKLPELIPQIVYNIKPSPIGKAFSENSKGLIGLVSGSSRYGVNQLGEKLQVQNRMPRRGPDTRTPGSKAAFSLGKMLEWRTKK